MPAIDTFSARNAPDQITSPTPGAFVVTPSDANELPIVTRCLYIGTAGALRVTTMNDEDVTFPNVAAGTKQGRYKKVWATGTTATGIVGEY